jgi:hypothetical protein
MPVPSRSTWHRIRTGVRLVGNYLYVGLIYLGAALGAPEVYSVYPVTILSLRTSRKPPTSPEP